MKSFPAVLLLVVFSCQVQASDLYTIRPYIAEKELRGIYVDVLAKFARHAEGLWHQSPSDPKAGYWGNGLSGGNEGIRAVGNTALVYATLAKETDALDAETRRAYIERAVAGIRYVAESHVTGSQKCVDGKQWGKSWQSAMWTGNMGFAAWILWDELDPGLRAAVERVVTHEADRFLDRKPSGNRWRDTKAEENGWDQMCISLAANMFPDHANAERWREKSIEYMMNTLSAPQDLNDQRLVDGRPVKEWVSTVNTHPDFTLENHGFFHPSYTMVSAAEIGQGALFYAYAGRPIPEAAGHHLMDNWHLLQTILLPSADWAFPQGMDWELHSDSHIHYLAWVAAYTKDPLAAEMERRLAQYLRDQQKIRGDGRLAGPGSRLGYAREAIQALRTSFSYLYHKYLGPAADDRTAEQMQRRLNGVRRYIPVDLITHRTGSKFASFSWDNNVMGLVMPTGSEHEGNPHFTTPITNGLVGNFVTADRSARGLQVVERSWKKLDDGFETRGTLLVNGGLLKQELKVISLGEKAVVYLDRVTAVQDVRIEQELGIPIGIENDELTGNRRTLYHEDGAQIIVGPETDNLVRIPGKWANVDGRLGIVMALGSGLAYRDVPNYNRNGAREDFLYGSYSTEPREFKAGEEVVRRAVVFFVETTPEETARLAEEMDVEDGPDGLVLRLPLAEGTRYLDL